MAAVVRSLILLCLLAGAARGDALVTAVEPGSAAFRAGLRPADILLKADGVPVSQLLNLRYAAAVAGKSGAASCE
jgi:S1-C subfamily serine protease